MQSEIDHLEKQIVVKNQELGDQKNNFDQAPTLR